MKNGTVCWRGRQWLQGVLEECLKADRCRKCPRSLAASWTVPRIRCSRPSQMPRILKVGESPTSDKCLWSALLAQGWCVLLQGDKCPLSAKMARGGRSPQRRDKCLMSAKMAPGVSPVRWQDGARLGCPQQGGKMPIVCLDGSMLGCPRASFRGVPRWLMAGVSQAERTSVRWASEVGKSPAEARICERPPSLVWVKGRLGAKWCELRLDKFRHFLLVAQWPEMCAGRPRPSRLQSRKEQRKVVEESSTLSPCRL